MRFFTTPKRAEQERQERIERTNRANAYRRQNLTLCQGPRF